MNHCERAKELFLEGYNCAQSVFAAFCDVTGMEEGAALRLASSFGAGMGGLREVCGACSAMFMVSGIRDGYDRLDNDEKKAHYRRIQQLGQTFTRQNGSLICRELLKAHGSSVSPVPSLRTEAYYKTRPCLRYVEDAACILERYLEAEQK